MQSIVLSMRSGRRRSISVLPRVNPASVLWRDPDPVCATRGISARRRRLQAGNGERGAVIASVDLCPWPHRWADCPRGARRDQRVDVLGKPPITREDVYNRQVALDVAAIVLGMTRAHGAQAVTSLPKWWQDLPPQP